MPWTYSQSRGRVTHTASGFDAYSGRHAGLNQPLMQMFKDIGPIPRGRYKMMQPYDSTNLGAYVIRLTPFPCNEMFGRRDFTMHSERIMGPAGEASHESIVIACQARHAMWKSGDRELVVVE